MIGTEVTAGEFSLLFAFDLLIVVGERAFIISNLNVFDVVAADTG